MKIEQFVMAYGVEHDRLRAILPPGYTSLRPVLRINAEIRGGSAYIELNTAVEHDGVRGWVNIGLREDAAFERSASSVTFRAGALEITHTGTGLWGGCPAEKDNGGCFYGGVLRPAESIAERKEFTDCSFIWHIPGGAHGRSIGKTLPALPSAPQHVYENQALTVENTAVIPCIQVLGAYRVTFERGCGKTES